MQGIVVKSTGSWYQVLTENGQLIQARMRGKLRLAELDTTNPIAVGDNVILLPDENHLDAVLIKEIIPRKNHIIRKSNKLSSQRQVIAANLDLALLVVSLVAPRTSTGFIDRFLLCCEAFHIPGALFFNKMDILPEEGLDMVSELHGLYSQLGYTCFEGSALNKHGLDNLRTFLHKKTTLIAGHSGVGKSTLINGLYPEIGAKVGAISRMHDKGKHTTTFAEMFFTEHGALIDTPGIRDFGVVDLEPHEIAQYFPEMRTYSAECKFNNCIHINEPGCAVKAALEMGKIDEGRYYNYLSIMRGEDSFN